MGKNRQEYIHNVAKTVMRQIGGIDYPVAHEGSNHISDTGVFAEELWQKYAEKIIACVGRMGAEARGRISSCGAGLNSNSQNFPFYAVFQGRGLDSPTSHGDAVLTLLASYIVVAAIVDNIRADVRRMREAT